MEPLTWHFSLWKVLEALHETFDLAFSPLAWHRLQGVGGGLLNTQILTHNYLTWIHPFGLA